MKNKPIYQQKRCFWANLNNPLYVDYHDKEWGKPVFEDNKLFEFIILESAQAGLSFEIILKKREAYKKAYANFDPLIVANYNESKVEELLNNSNLVKNRKKIVASIENAKVFLQIQKEFGSFSNYLWSFVNNTPIKNSWISKEDIPLFTNESIALYKDLKNRGFKFFGKITTYAYMQAMGLVNDHLVDCFCFSSL